MSEGKSAALRGLRSAASTRSRSLIWTCSFRLALESAIERYSSSVALVRWNRRSTITTNAAIATNRPIPICRSRIENGLCRDVEKDGSEPSTLDDDWALLSGLRRPKMASASIPGTPSTPVRLLAHLADSPRRNRLELGGSTGRIHSRSRDRDADDSSRDTDRAGRRARRRLQARDRGSGG